MATNKNSVRPACAVDSCDRLAWCRGWCQNHYNSWHRYGDPEQVDRNKAARPTECKVDGCCVRPHAYGYCSPHAHRFRKHGDPLGGKELTSNDEKVGFLKAMAAWPKSSDECVIWPFSLMVTGYGYLIGPSGTQEYAHRRSLEVASGESAPEGMHAAHSCHNPACVSPNHLRWATPAENMDDKKDNGTWGCHLTEKQARAILADAGLLREVAERHGVSMSFVSAVRSGSAWGWLQEK